MNPPGTSYVLEPAIVTARSKFLCCFAVPAERGTARWPPRTAREAPSTARSPPRAVRGLPRGKRGSPEEVHQRTHSEHRAGQRRADELDQHPQRSEEHTS